MNEQVLDDVSNIYYPLNPIDVLATVYTQVKLPPLIPPMYLGETRKSSPLPLERGGLGWGNLKNNSASITCVYTGGCIGGKQENQVPSPYQDYGVHTTLTRASFQP